MSFSPTAALREKAREWAQKVVALNNTDVPPSLEPEKQRLLSFARKVKVAIEKVFGSVDELEDIGLGLPIAIPVIAIAAAATAITKWTLEHEKFLKRFVEAKRLESLGIEPDKAAQIVNQIENKKTFLTDVAKKIVPVALIAGGFILYARKKGW